MKIEETENNLKTLKARNYKINFKSYRFNVQAIRTK